MRKGLLKTLATIFTTAILLTGCSAKSGENLKAAECVIVPPEKPFACTMQYDPVCGCDGKTYGNACMARGAGVPSSTPGTCEKSLNN